jgi:hypothetical protein
MESGGPRGYVSGKKGQNAQAPGDGRHRRTRFDPGAQLADVQDGDGAPVVLRLSRPLFPFMIKAFADSGYAGGAPAQATYVIGVVKKPSEQIGFTVHPRR